VAGTRLHGDAIRELAEELAEPVGCRREGDALARLDAEFFASGVPE
jgi:hypothetical protein